MMMRHWTDPGRKGRCGRMHKNVKGKGGGVDQKKKNTWSLLGYFPLENARVAAPLLFDHGCGVLSILTLFGVYVCVMGSTRQGFCFTISLPV